MKHILASTTRQWNCGDEFILFGVRNLIDELLYFECNWSIFNRSPALRSRNLDNSWSGQSLQCFDHIIVAGTPEWFGAPLQALFRMVKEEQRKVSFLGIGYPSSDVPLTKLDLKVLKEADVISCRDENSFMALKKEGIQSRILPCPALFASGGTEVRKGKRIACVFQNDRVPMQKIPRELKKHCLAEFKDMQCDIIAHHFDDYLFACSHFNRVRYSYDAREYLTFYDDYDLVVSTRLHGALLALSLGIPAILVSQDEGLHHKRLKGAAAEFPLRCCAPSEMRGVINQELEKIRETSLNLITFKYSVSRSYMELLNEHFSA